MDLGTNISAISRIVCLVFFFFLRGDDEEVRTRRRGHRRDGDGRGAVSHLARVRTDRARASSVEPGRSRVASGARGGGTAVRRGPPGRSPTDGVSRARPPKPRRARHRDASSGPRRARRAANDGGRGRVRTSVRPLRGERWRARATIRRREPPPTRRTLLGREDFSVKFPRQTGLELEVSSWAEPERDGGRRAAATRVSETCHPFRTSNETPERDAHTSIRHTTHDHYDMYDKKEPHLTR